MRTTTADVCVMNNKKGPQSAEEALERAVGLPW